MRNLPETRDEALDAIDHAYDTETTPYGANLRALSVEWIGHPQDGLTMVEVYDLLREYVDEVYS